MIPCKIPDRSIGVFNATLHVFSIGVRLLGYRARIALALKGIQYEPVNVVGGRGSDDLKKQEYLDLNPSAVVPTLVDGDSVLTQSIPIMEYLEETYPETPILPADAAGRARVRAIAQVMVSDTHPLRTARVVEFIYETLGQEKEDLDQWLKHWNERGFGAVEWMLADGRIPGDFCHGNEPTMANICLVAQIFVVEKFGADLSGLANVNRIHGTCMAHPAFRDTAPGKQPDNPDHQK